MESKDLGRKIERTKLEEENKCLKQRVDELEVQIVDLTSKLIQKDEESTINNATWNNEYGSLLGAFDELKS